MSLFERTLTDFNHFNPRLSHNGAVLFEWDEGYDLAQFLLDTIVQTKPQFISHPVDDWIEFALTPYNGDITTPSSCDALPQEWRLDIQVKPPVLGHYVDDSNYMTFSLYASRDEMMTFALALRDETNKTIERESN